MNRKREQAIREAAKRHNERIRLNRIRDVLAEGYEEINEFEDSVDVKVDLVKAGALDTDTGDMEVLDTEALQTPFWVVAKPVRDRRN